MDNLKILKTLLIDDDHDMVLFIPRYLSKLGFEVTFMSTYPGPERIKNQKYDLIILDQRLGDNLSGTEIAQELYQDSSTRNIPKFILTGLEDDPEIARCLEEGIINGVIIKEPGKVKENLESKLKKYIRS